jgi:transcriptional regulator with XRE-family HTH domain
MSLRKKFGRRLKLLREQKSMTQAKLAKATKLSLSFIRSIEQGVHAPSFESLEAIAKALNIEIADLFK